LAVDHGRIFGAQVDNDIRDILWMNETTGRGARSGALQKFLAVRKKEEGIGVDRARRDRVDAHALGRELSRRWRTIDSNAAFDAPTAV
jgi:hypothetical protein